MFGHAMPCHTTYDIYRAHGSYGNTHVRTHIHTLHSAMSLCASLSSSLLTPVEKYETENNLYEIYNTLSR